MGLIDLPSSRDFIESVNWVQPADKSDPSRSTTDWAIGSQDSSLPIMDSGFAADGGGDSFITEVQTTMKNPNILGLNFFAYAGPIDGKKSGKWFDHLKNVLIQFGWALKKKFPDKDIPVMVSGAGISQGGYRTALSLLNVGPKVNSEEEKKTNDKIKMSEKDVIKSFQSFFSESQPIIGQLYSGEISGEMNSELVAAAQATESVIAKAIKNKAVYGALFNIGSKRFNTSKSDLEDALSLIKTHQFPESVAYLDTKSRILALSAIINE